MNKLMIVGLGPGDLDHAPSGVRDLLTNAEYDVILRTIEHPAARQLTALRPVETCDDLYDQHTRFADVYDAIAARVLGSPSNRPVVYAVPGSPYVGERSVTLIREAAPAAGVDVTVITAESFIDAICGMAGVDPLFDGLRVMDGRDLPDILWLDVPTIIGHVDVPIVMADVAARLHGILGGQARVAVASELGTSTARLAWMTVGELAADLAGYRVSLLLPPTDAGLLGAIQTMRTLRQECPWDREQTHHSITNNLVEEAYELADALSALPAEAPGGEPDFGAYADLEEELGDVLLQVLFHATMAEEAGATSIDGLAEILRQKLVRRHPHVFADTEVTSTEDVVANWDAIKESEKTSRQSKLDGVPRALPPLALAQKLQERAARAGFDWPETAPVRRKLDEELAELDQAATSDERLDEFGDVLFTIVNLGRHLDIDPSIALRRSAARFDSRFRSMESDTSLEGKSLQELDELWDQAKAAEGSLET